MAKQIINIGQTPNDKTGDPLRTAFEKVNANFDELYGADTAPIYHLGDDVQFVDIDAGSGLVQIQSGFDTGAPVYIKGASCSDGGTGGDVWIEAGGAALPNLGTDGVVSVAGRNITLETNNTNIWTFDDAGKLTVPSNGAGIYWDNPDAPPEPLGGWFANSSINFDKDLGTIISMGVGGVGGYTWIFGKDGNLKLPLGGGIVDSNGDSVLGGGGGNTGNISFDSSGNYAGIYNNQGGPVYISNFSYVTQEAETAWIQIPAGNSTDAVRIVQEQGNVWIEAQSKLWNFQSNGILTLPSSNYLETTDVNLKVGSQGTVTIRSDAASNLTTKEWVFETDGVLTLPVSGSITTSGSDASGTSVSIASDFQAQVDVSGTSINVTNNVQNQQIVQGWTIVFNDGTTRIANANTGNSGPSGEYIIGYDTPYESLNGFPITAYGLDYVPAVPPELTLTVNSTSWVLNADGKLHLPVGGDIVDSTGTSVLGSSSPIALNDLTDVVAGEPNVNEKLGWNGAAWVPQTTDRLENGGGILAINGGNVQIMPAPSGNIRIYPGNTTAVMSLQGHASTRVEYTSSWDPYEDPPLSAGLNTLTQLELVAGGFTINNSRDTGLGNDYNHIWEFDNNGVLTLPNGATLSNNGLLNSAFPGSSEIAGVAADNGNNRAIAWIGGVNIETNKNVAENTWTFGTDGVLTLPGDIVDSNSVSVIGREPKFEFQNQTFNAVAGKRYAIDNQGAQIGVILPGSPNVGDAIYFVDAMGTFGPSTYLTIAGNGNNIMGLSSQQITTANESIGVFYNGSEWRFYG